MDFAKASRECNFPDKKNGENLAVGANSDEEVEWALRDIIEKHRENKKTKEKPKTFELDHEIEEDSDFCFTGNSGPHAKELQGAGSNCENAVNDIRQLIKYFLAGSDADKSFGEKSLSDYEKLGAIPKANSRIRREKEKSQPEHPEVRVPKASPKAQKGDSGVEQDKGITCSPFFYVVPEDPSPDFVLPGGTYYVVPQKRSHLLSGRVIVHPTRTDEQNRTSGVYSNSRDNHASPEHLNNLGKVSDSRLNLGQIGNLPWEWETQSLSDVASRKSDLEVEIKNLKSSLSACTEDLKCLNTFEDSLNLVSAPSPQKSWYEKPVVTWIEEIYEGQKSESGTLKLSQQLVDLFPMANEEYLIQRAGGCQRMEDLLDLIASEFASWEDKPGGVDANFLLLATELEHLDMGRIYKLWTVSEGDAAKIKEIISNEKWKPIKLKFAEEFSDLNADDLDEREDLDDPNSIESELLERKIQTQFKRMVSALPEDNVDTLLEKCKQFKGDEDLVDAFIEETQRVNENHRRALDLQFIFPDADLEFLKREVEKLNGEDELNDFTSRLLEEKNYPKFEEPDVNGLELWHTYIYNFSLADYLLKVPEPKKFEASQVEPGRGLAFLRLRYPGAHNLEHLFELSGNLCLTCIDLDEEYTPVMLRSLPMQRELFDEALLQEISYVEHREEIRKHLDELEAKKELERREAEMCDAFLTCPLCANEEVIPSETVTCPDGHVFCRDCIKRYIDVKVGDGLYSCECPLGECGMTFTHSTLERIVPSSLLKKIVKKQQAVEISGANIEGLESCHFCEFAYIPKPEDKIFKCLNCKAETCRKCGEKNHIPIRCEEVERPKDLEARKKVEETMTAALVRNCPRCGKKFVKIDGCNKITCTCGALVCYICRRIINGYDHFRHGGCQLHTNNTVLHEDEVVQSGIEIRDRILGEDPELRIMFDPSTNRF